MCYLQAITHEQQTTHERNLPSAHPRIVGADSLVIQKNRSRTYRSFALLQGSELFNYKSKIHF